MNLLSQKLTFFLLLTAGWCKFKVFNSKNDQQPKNAYEIVKIGRNMTGFATNLEIYESYLEAPSLISWSKVCDSPELGIFSWGDREQNNTQVIKKNMFVV